MEVLMETRDKFSTSGEKCFHYFIVFQMFKIINWYALG